MNQDMSVGQGQEAISDYKKGGADQPRELRRVMVFLL